MSLRGVPTHRDDEAIRTPGFHGLLPPYQVRGRNDNTVEVTFLNSDLRITDALGDCLAAVGWVSA